MHLTYFFRHLAVAGSLLFAVTALLVSDSFASPDPLSQQIEQRLKNDPRFQILNSDDRTQRGIPVTYVGSGQDCDTADLDSALINAASGTEIRLQNETFKGNFGIASKDLALIGGFEDCTASKPAFSSTLDGTGNGGKTVLDIFEAQNSGGSWTVELENLTIINGDESSPLERGGGLHVEDNFLVNLTDVVIRDNRTEARGGGLMVLGDEATVVTIRGDSIIDSNTAQEGGGLACVGPVDTPGENQPLVVIDTALVWRNEALRGGGVYSKNCVVLSYAGGFLQGIVNNTATAGSGADTGQGGGIFAEQQSGIGLFGVPGLFGIGDPDSPALLAGNEAASIGGGALIRGGSQMRATDAVIENNSAGNNGGGINVTDSSFTMERVDGTTCGASRCSRLRGNSALIGGGISVVNSNEGPVRGAIGTASNVQITQTFISNNRATGSGPIDDGFGAAVFLLEGSAYLEGNVMFGNSGANLIRQQPNTSLTLAWSTVANNTSNGGELFLARGASTGETQISLLSSILQNPGGEILSLDSTTGSGFDFFANCLVANELTSMPGVSASIVDPNPGFIDADMDDYHLHHNSSAVDFCSGSNVPVERDMDEQDRGLDVIPGGKAYDAGADEQQGEIFIDGFESSG